jgi:drug/metabolite transporter (DMT)-like permease
MTRDVKTYLELHFVVLLFGFTGILGKLINLPAPELVVFRMFFAFVSLYIILRFQKVKIKPTRKLLWSSLAVGFIVAAHWTTFFLAIKLSNVSVALGLLGVGTLFTALMEPLILKKKFSGLEIIVAVFIIAGIYIIFHFEGEYFWGILTAIISFFLSSLFSAFNKKLSHIYDSRVISFYELIFGFGLAAIALPFLAPMTEGLHWPDWKDLIYLILLGSICTAYAFTAAIRLMNLLSAYLVVLHINLEPVYAIIIAYLLFGESEHMSTGFYIGASIITVSVFFFPYFRKKLNVRQKRKAVT